MAFRLRRTEAVADGLRRLARKELRSARVHLRRTRPPSAEAVHEARKSVKKVRAIVSVIDADGGGGLRNSAKRLRSVNRTLSRLRDADVMIESLAMFRRKYPQVLSEHTFARMRRHLRARALEIARKAGRDGTWKKVDRKLGALRKRARRWRPAHGGLGALAPGIRSAHRRGQKALARARTNQRPADFHEWRQVMKTLWYQLRLVEGSSPAVRRDVRALHRAETQLGDDHNVAVLCAALSGDPLLADGHIDMKRLQCAADAYQRHLREQAMSRARRIYGAASGVYLRHIERAWKAWHRPARARKAATRGRAAA